MQRIIKAGLFLGTLVLAGILRVNKYAELPLPGQSMDEYSNAWVGLSLIESGVPRGLSGIGGYKNEDRKYINIDNVFSSGVVKGDPMVINWPWMDHPPGAGLITGGWARLGGVRSLATTRIGIIRKPMVAIACISVALLFILGWLYYGYSTGLAAGLIYAVSPMVVFGSRMGQAENFVIPMFLLNAIALDWGIKKKRNGFVYLAGFLAGLALWFKFSAIYILLFSILVLWKNGEIKKIKYLGLGFVAPVVAFIYYIFRLGLPTFLAVNLANSSRVYGIGLDAIMNLVLEQKITHTLFLRDPWVVAGWLAFWGNVFALGRDSKKNEPLVYAGLVYLLIYVMLGSYSFGWYTYPFIPIVVLIFAKSMIREIKRPMFSWILLMVIGGLVAKFIKHQEVELVSRYWRGAILGLGVGSFFQHRAGKYINYSLFVIAVAVSAYYCLNLSLSAWYGLH